MRQHRPRLTPVVTTIVVAVAACSGQATMSQSEAEKQISAALEKQVGRKPDKVTCPGDIDAKVGETMRCTLTADDVTFGLEMKITSVDGDDAKFDIKVDEEPVG